MSASKKKIKSKVKAKAKSGRAPKSGPKSASKLKARTIDPRKRLEVTYKGRVQGVGFRFNAEQAALGCGVTGWVRNEPNGDVMLVAEGPESCLSKLLDAVRECPVGRHITKQQIRWEPCRNEFTDFRIEYHL